MLLMHLYLKGGRAQAEGEHPVLVNQMHPANLSGRVSRASGKVSNTQNCSGLALFLSLLETFLCVLFFSYIKGESSMHEPCIWKTLMTCPYKQLQALRVSVRQFVQWDYCSSYFLCLTHFLHK